ncbi:hypothetical protein HYC85_013034 [Camellia sinensis]|uniref:Uncharacterized protein n=1 Tax=Camellia sinensis TaxID=4442 RepID=A0A7J7HFQ0_CAMSI|nr:hypothetical protein HYC85_013034 [Camellia sinensis]
MNPLSGLEPLALLSLSLEPNLGLHSREVMQLPHTTTMLSPSLVASKRGFETPDMPCGCCEHSRDFSDLVALISVYWVIPKLGKLVFWQTMYVGGERQEEGFEISNSELNQMDKTLYIGGEHIACRIWEVAVCMTAIPVLIGTKFNDFVQLPIDVQWTIATRAYARALKATLCFSRATYNINVNKIFEFITAKLFNLPWAPERNLTIGEPIINF